MLTRFMGSKPLASAIACVTVFAGVWGAAASADPAQDAVAQLNELSRQAEQLTESMHAA